MKISPLPINEKKRLEAIRRYHILDTEDEEDFDGLVQLAIQLCNVPIAIITFVDGERQWFKAEIGLGIKETHRNLSFCSHTILEDKVMIVTDALEDERFFDNPLVTATPFIRFYAGVPLITTTGFILGSLAVIDRVPRVLTEQQLKNLEILAKQVLNLLDFRHSLSQLQIINTEIAQKVAEKTEEIKGVFERVSDAFVALNNNWCYTYANTKAEQIFSKPPGYLIGKHIWSEFPEGVGQPFHLMYEEAMVTQQYRYLEEYYAPQDRWFENHIYPSPEGISIYFRDITQRKKVEEKIVKESELSNSFINSVPGIFYMFDANGKFIRWNKNFETISGYSAEEISTLHPLDFFDDDEKELLKENILKAFKEGAAEVEAHFLSKHKIKTPYYFSGFAVTFNDQPCIAGMGIDITELKKTTKSLRQAEERYRNIFENATEGIYQSTPTGQFITVNPAMAKMFGYSSPSELIASILEIGSQLFVDQQDRLRLRQTLETHGQAIGLEFKLLKKNNEPMWVSSNNRTVKDNTGTVKYFEGTLKDITEQKEMEEKLRLQKQLDKIITRTQALFIGSENSRVAFDALLQDILDITQSEYGFIGEVLTDLNGRPYLKTHTITNIAWNDETKKYYNENINEGLIFDNLKSLFGAVMVTGKPVISNAPHIDPRRGGLPKGHPPLLAFLGLPFGSDGKMEGMLGLSNRAGGYDENLIQFLEPLTGAITNLIKAAQYQKLRKQAELALRNSENKLKAFFRSTHDASLLLNKNMEILAFNSSAIELHKSTFGKNIYEGETFLKFASDQNRHLVIDFFQKALVGEVIQEEMLLPNIYTTVSAWWSVTFMPAYDREGTIFGAVVNATNINEMKGAEFKLKNQFEELQKTNYELDRFVYSVSHDLRAPLASILGLITIAFMEDPSPAQKNYLELIRKNINRLDGFIRDILSYSTNSRSEVNTDKINFRELIAETRSKLSYSSGSERLKINIEIQDAFPFYSDRLRIEIFMNNLFTNALKYQDFRKDYSFLTVSIVTSADSVSIKFSDNGIGIEKKYIDKIFDMFYRASENAKGSGLGLYIVKETITKLGGSIKVQSEFGLSTEFFIEIPSRL